ncbi:Mechanosensitive ion channel-domain-containing protein [Mycena floridula]|nr:Mechanosensitive ion channel-domain-containing protein [Mycena floridula]
MDNPSSSSRPYDRVALSEKNSNSNEDHPTATPLLAPPTAMCPPRRPGTAVAGSSSQSSLPLAKNIHLGGEPIEMKNRNKPYDAEQGRHNVLGGIKRLERNYEECLRFADGDGDVPKNKVTTRNSVIISCVLGILWIPGILVSTKFPDARVFEVGLLWWSIWLSVVWGGWWAAVAAANIISSIIRAMVAIDDRTTWRYIIDLHPYVVAFFMWSVAIWISWNPIIDNRQTPTASTDRSVHIIDLIGRLLFAVFLISTVLLFEKFAIKWIARKFHDKSYAERIKNQTFAVKSLATLHRNLGDISGCSNTLPDKKPSTAKFFKQAMKYVSAAATTITICLGNVASEIARNESPNCHQAMVETALKSANGSRSLADDLFSDISKKLGKKLLHVKDIERFFPNKKDAHHFFTLFDKDDNGDVTKEEMEMACVEFHREQLFLKSSKQNLKTATEELDHILMSVFVVVALLMIAVALEVQVSTLIASAGLSWLIGASLAEVLTSIIFLFVKYPFDVGDRVDLNKVSYTVEEIWLLSTVFLDSNSVYVQVPNTMLNAMFIQNISRSPQISENFTFDVSYRTTSDQLEKLQKKMLAFLNENSRDYQHAFDVATVDFPEQEKMTLSVDIKYKRNGQQALKAKRRDKWIWALKNQMSEVQIFGPKGNPNASAGPARYTQVPWEEAKREKVHSAEPVGGWHLADRNADMYNDADNVFGNTSELNLTNPRRNPSQGASAAAPIPVVMPGMPPVTQMPQMPPGQGLP